MWELDDIPFENAYTSETYEMRDPEWGQIAKEYRFASYLARKGRRLIFAANLPNHSPHSEIRQFFSSFGTIESTENEATYSFIAFCTRDGANRALTDLNRMNPPLFRGRRLRVELAMDKDWAVDLRMRMRLLYRVPNVRTVLYCSGLQHNSRLQDMCSFFANCGRVASVFKEAHYGFITYRSPEDASSALELFKSSRAPRFRGCRLTVESANVSSRLTVESANGTDGIR